MKDKIRSLLKERWNEEKTRKLKTVVELSGNYIATAIVAFNLPPNDVKLIPLVVLSGIKTIYDVKRAYGGEEPVEFYTTFVEPIGKGILKLIQE